MAHISTLERRNNCTVLNASPVVNLGGSVEVKKIKLQNKSTNKSCMSFCSTRTVSSFVCDNLLASFIKAFLKTYFCQNAFFISSYIVLRMLYSVYIMLYSNILLVQSLFREVLCCIYHLDIGPKFRVASIIQTLVEIFKRAK